MARIRSIKPSIWGDDKFAGLSRDARLLTLGLISAADDDGRFIATPAVIAGAVYPHDQLGPATIRKWRDEIARTGLIRLYKVGGRDYGWFPNWKKHQVINRSSPSVLPPPPGVGGDPGPPEPPPDDGDSVSHSRSDSRSRSPNSHGETQEALPTGRGEGYGREGNSSGYLGSSVTEVDARLLPLRTALDDVRLHVRWDKLNPAAVDRVAWLAEAHGVPALVAAAQRAWQRDNPPAFANAWLAVWDSLPLPRPRLVAARCETHMQDLPCRSCAADAKAVTA